MEPRYLGDGVYFSFVDGNVILTTGHHEEGRADNVIHLEPEVIMSLMKALSEIPKHIKP